MAAPSFISLEVYGQADQDSGESHDGVRNSSLNTREYLELNTITCFT